MNPLTPWVTILFQAGAMVYVVAALTALLKARLAALMVFFVGLLFNTVSIGLKL